jgi:NADH-ubiquinone oxidoreductase chain 1
VFLNTLSSILFLGGYLVPGIESNGLITDLSLGFKTSFILFLFIWIKASFPRLRYDQLMGAIWSKMLPIVIAFSILIPCIIKVFEIYIPLQRVYELFLFILINDPKKILPYEYK